MSRLNVVIVILDTARRDRFGCYGYARRTTPVVDELARGALVFDQMITPAPWTVPSHGSLFTGLYPREHVAHFPVPVLRKDCMTLARHLVDRGYTTACISANPLLTRTGLEDGFQVVLARKDVDTGAARRRARFMLGLHDKGSGAVVRQVDRLLGTTIRAPFFALVNFMECHWPYFPPRRFEAEFVRHAWPWWRSAWRRVEERHGRLQAWEAIALANDETMARLHDLYDAALATADDRVGLLLDSLQRHGHADDTVVIVAADHGENIGDHGMATHQGSLHQTLIHVPFIARIPGRVPARLSGLAQFTDVFAGLCRILGLEAPVAVRDRPMSVDPFTLSVEDAGREYAFAEWQHWGEKQMQTVQGRSPHYDLSVIPVGLEAVQDRRFKLVVRMDTGEETLYDLVDDPDETQNAVVDAPHQAQRLRAALHQWRALFPAAEPAAYTVQEVAGLEGRLRDLGYI